MISLTDIKNDFHNSAFEATSSYEEDVINFLQQSNEIEGVSDKDSLEDAKIAWEFIMGFHSLTIERVCHVHQLLMKRQNIQGKWKGNFRDIDVYIGGDVALDPAFIKDNMKAWCTEMGRDGKRGDFKDYHVRFEKIHPFVDGNGRTGRILMNWHRLKKLGRQLLIINTGEEQLKYYGWFH